MHIIVRCHKTLMFYLLVIIIFVTFIMLQIIIIRKPVIKKNGLDSRAYWMLTDNLINRIMQWNVEDTLERVWTEYPTAAILFIVIPVLIMMFSFEEVEITRWEYLVKIIGNQWYWSYEVVSSIHDSDSDLVTVQTLNFDSRLLPEDALLQRKTGLRLLTVDNALVLPILKPIHIFVTSIDVIHSWSVPSLGIKIDAVPGRINHTSFILTRPGIFYGQCSELCGTNHGFMPIMIAGIPIWS